MNVQSDIRQAHELKNLLFEIRRYSIVDISPEEFVPVPEKTISSSELIDILKTKLRLINKFYNSCEENTGEFLIIDVRSESEYRNACIPFSINMPILNDVERHKVGLIYTKHSESSGLSLACHYARGKEKEYIEKAGHLIKEYNSENIIIYCRRGGGRSRYVADLLKKYDIDSSVLEGGIKEFKSHVHDLLYNNFLRVISLSGQTGCGKSEILDYFKEKNPDVPVIHLENCAGHASSVFGEIRYMPKDITVHSQNQFEINLFREILPHITKENIFPVFLTENESRKIGNFFIPPAVMKGLEEENHIEIICPLEERINRLARDYFAVDSGDINLKSELKQKVLEQVRLLGRKTGKSKLKQYEKWIKGDEFSLFLKDIINSYYDKIYKKPVKEPLLIIENNDIETEVNKILNFLDGYSVDL